MPVPGSPRHSAYTETMRAATPSESPDRQNAAAEFALTDRGAICVLHTSFPWVPMELEERLKERGVRAHVSLDGRVHAAIPFVSDEHADRIRKVLDSLESERTN